MQHYHYIFTGSGLSALMTVYEMALSGKFEDKSILLIDEAFKNSNDRTWCFWDDGNTFDALISKKWEQAFFADATVCRRMDLSPYRYKMIRSKDFYKWMSNEITKHPNIHWLHEKVIDFQELGHHCVVKTGTSDSELAQQTKSFTCNKIFNSILHLDVVKKQTKYPLLQQHFIGWFIKSQQAVFNENCATFMDFSVEQKGNTRFMYVLPTSGNEALVEYTLFSKDALTTEEYESEIKNYLHKIGISDYEIIEKEHGNIPMTSYPFWKNNTTNILNIGSAGGWTKASTGYTFKNTIQKSKAVTQFLQTENDFRKFNKETKFWYYDLLFLDVLSRRNDLGSTVFSGLFRNGNPNLIFKFLDEETTFSEDLKVIRKCPKPLFLKAFVRRIFQF